jgi:hypothetical protein
MMRLGVSLTVVVLLQGSIVSGQRSIPKWTLVERVQRASAVAVIQVVSEGRVRAVDATDALVRRNPGVIGRSVVVPLTEWDVRVLEATKSSGLVVSGATVTVATRGGSVRAKGQNYFADGPSFSLVKDRTYLVFLTFNEALGTLMISDFDVFGLDADRPTTVGNGALTPYGKEILSQEKGAVLESVRLAAGN